MLSEVSSTGKLDRGLVTMFFNEPGWEIKADKWAKKYGAELGKYYKQVIKDGSIIVCYVIKDKNGEY